MTKISFDVDFSKDPEKILQEIQERAKAEVEKRESKEKASAYLSTLHEKVNEELKTDYKSVTDLIRALTPFASSSLKDKISSTSPSGRRKTVSMNKETYDQIKDLLSQANPNKAAIGRETGVSVVQVRKVASGGYDEKFAGAASTSPTVESPSGNDSTIDKPASLDLSPPADEAPEKEDDLPTPPAPAHPSEDESPASPPPSATDLPSPPSFEDDEEDEAIGHPDLPSTSETFDDADELPAPPSFGDDSEVTTPPSPNLPSPPSIGDDEESAEDAKPDLSSPPSFGDDADETPPPPTPDLPSPPSFGGDDADETPPPPAPDLPSPPSFGDDNAQDEDTENEIPAPPTPAGLPPSPPSFGDAPEPPSPLPPGLPPAPPSFGDAEEEKAPPSPDLPPAPPSLGGSDEPPAPPVPPLPPSPPSPDTSEVEPPSPPAAAPEPKVQSLTRPPALGAKPTLKSGKSGKPSLSLKAGKTKTKGLKLTRPPQGKPLPPPS
jgi:hypothetical protein